MSSFLASVGRRLVLLKLRRMHGQHSRQFRLRLAGRLLQPGEQPFGRPQRRGGRGGRGLIGRRGVSAEGGQPNRNSQRRRRCRERAAEGDRQVKGRREEIRR